AASGGILVAGGGLLALGALALALAWQQGTARGAIAEWAGHPPPVTGHGEGVLVLVSLTTMLLGGALLVRAILRVRPPAT
ncbi:hypothetical protein, partial [Actinotalea sp. C106]|uniref:hypothetical protein n=1 Tax=Actinotalea sp. C106 TaxID=2908644 RepID=UPI0020290D65